MTSIEKLIDILESTLDSSWQLPMSGGKVVLDVKKIKELIEDARRNLPSEIIQAKKIVLDRSTIIEKARKEAENMIRTSEDKIKTLVSKNEIVKAAKAQAEEILTEAESKAKAIKSSSDEYAHNVIKNLEESVTNYLTEIRKLRHMFQKGSLEPK